MRDGEKFVLIERGTVIELLDGVNARKRKREDSKKQEEGVVIEEIVVDGVKKVREFCCRPAVCLRRRGGLYVEGTRLENSVLGEAGVRGLFSAA